MAVPYYDDAILRNKAGTSFYNSQLIFPLENQDRSKAVASFQAVEVEPPAVDDVRKLTRSLLDTANKVTKFNRSEATDELSDEDLNASSGFAQGYPSNNQSRLKPVKYKILNGEKASLFIPVGFVVNDTIDYQNADLGQLGLTGLRALEAGGTLRDATNKVVSTGINAMKDILSPGGSLSGIAAQVALSRLATKVPLGGGPALQSALQVTLNPNTRSMFRGVMLREFAFQFKLIPTSSQEAREIKRIVKFFRKHAYPESIQLENIPVLYKFPSMFKIKLQYDGKDIGSRIKMSYLRNVQAVYGGTAASFHTDGEPTEIDLTLNFVEHRPLVRQDIEGGQWNNFADDDARYLDEGAGF